MVVRTFKDGPFDGQSVDVGDHEAVVFTAGPADGVHYRLGDDGLMHHEEVEIG